MQGLQAGEELSQCRTSGLTPTQVLSPDYTAFLAGLIIGPSIVYGANLHFDVKLTGL